jgi:hypothetical protein
MPHADVINNDNEHPYQRGALINSNLNATSKVQESVESDTAAWVDSISNGAMDSTMDDEISSSQSLPAPTSAKTRPITTARLNTKNGPQERYFKIPPSKEEFNKIIFNLMSAGS